MKNFSFTLSVFLPAKQLRQLSAMLAGLLITSMLPAKLFAQAPAISYGSPQVYIAGTAITALTPAVNGTVAAPGYNSTAVTIPTSFTPGALAVDKAGNIYTIGLSSSPSTPSVVYKIPAGGGSPVSIGSIYQPSSALAVDNSGNVYAFDGSLDVIKKIAATNGAITIVASGFDPPAGLAVDAGGNLYVANTVVASVKEVLAANGSVITIGSGFTSTDCIAVDALGNVYVTDSGAVKEIPAGGGGVITLASGSFFGLALDAAGNIYVSTQNNQGIDEIPVGATIKKINNYSSAFLHIALDGAGNLYFLASPTDVLSELKPTGGYYISPFLPAGLNFNSTTGVISGTPTASSPATNYTVTAYNGANSSQATVNITVNAFALSYSSPQVYVAGTAITALAPASVGVAAWGYANPVSIGSGFSSPIDVAADAAGNVYAIDLANNNVTKIPAGGGPQVVLASGFNGPRGIACDADGNVYVADTKNNAVKKISAGGAVSTIGSGFNSPLAVAVDGAGNVYVADNGSGSIKEIPAGGGATITLNSGFTNIGGVAVDAAGNIYGADEGFGSGALYKIPAGGGAMVAIGTGLSRPSGVATDAAGNIYVSDLGKSAAVVIEPDGSQFTIGSGFSFPNGIAVDGAGNVYIADSLNGAVKEIKITGGYFLSSPLPAGLAFNNNTGIISGTPSAASPATNYKIMAYNSLGGSTAIVNIKVNPLTINYGSPQVYTVGVPVTALTPAINGTVAAPGYDNATVVPTSPPDGFEKIAADAAGNIYVVSYSPDFPNAPSPVYKLPAGGGSPISVGSSANDPAAIAVDRAGNIYVSAQGGGIKKIGVNGDNTIVVASGFTRPFSIAVDAAGNIYVTDAYDTVMKEILAADGSVITIGSGFSNPKSIAVDAAGNLYVVDNGGSTVKELPAGGGGVITLASGSEFDGLAVDAAGNVYVTDGANIDEIPAGGTIRTIANVQAQLLAVDGSGNLYGVDTGIGILEKIKPTGGYYISPFLPAGLSFNSTTGVISGTPTAASPATNYTVTAYNSAGSSQATLNLTVNLAPPTISYGSPQNYTTGAAITALAPVSTGVAAWGYGSTVNIGSGFIAPVDVAADAAGNVYVADLATNHIVKIPAGNGTPVVLAAFTTPFGIAVDAAGNVYVAAASAGAILEIPAGGGAPNAIGSGFSAPSAVAVDGSGNVYVADAGNGALKKVPAGNGTPVTIKSGFASIQGVAVDAAGNVYVADAGVGTSGNGAVYKILPTAVGSGSMVSVGTGFSRPSGVVVDAAGNLYISDMNKTVITVIGPNGSQFTIGSGFSSPNGVAIDGLGNVYVADSGNGVVKEMKITGGYFLSSPLPAGLAFNNGTGVISGTPAATSPATNYTVTAYNSGGSAQAIINIAVNPVPPVISYSGPQVYTQGAAITALSPANSGAPVAPPGYNSAAVTFAGGFDQINGIVADKAGNVYASAFNNPPAVPSVVYKFPAGGGSKVSIASGFNATTALAVDSAGNVYLADGTGIKKIAASNGAITTFASGVGPAGGIAVDAAGNIYMTDLNNSAVKEILAVNGNVITIGSGFNNPEGIAVDALGNVYVADFGNNAVKEIPAPIAIGGGSVVTLASGSGFLGLTLDAAGNIYVNDFTNSVIDEIPAGGTIKTIVSARTSLIALDGAGNLYFPSSDNNNILELKPSGGYYVSPFLPAGLNFNSASGVISGTPIVASLATNYIVTAYNGASSAQAKINITVKVPPPAISTSGTLSALTTTYGTSSSSTSFNVSGAHMTAGILVTPPTGFEVSTDNSAFSNTVTIGSAGTIASTPVYVRLAASATAGNHSGNIVLSSAGAVSANLATVSSTVNGAPLTITANNVNKNFGTTLTGAAGSTAYSITGGALQNGNTISSVTIAYGTGASTFSAVGTYAGSVFPSVAVGANGFLSSNYHITYAKGDIIIGQALLTITARNINKNYGTAITGGADPTGYTITGGALKNGNTISSITIAYGAGSAATDVPGRYPGSVTPSAAAGANGFLAGNYNITYSPGNITVGKAALTITANNVNKPLGNTLTGGPGSTAFSITSGRLQNGETIGSVTLAYGTGALASAGLGTYTGSVIPSAASGSNGFLSTNYQITYAKGNIIVAKPVITATGTLTALSTMQGTPSISSSFMVSGTSIAAGILVTAPTGFEVSTDNITFSSSLAIAGINTIPAGPVYVRLTAADAAGSYSGNVVLTGLNAVTVNVPTMKSTVNPLLPNPVVQARLVTFTNTTANSTTVGWTNGNGTGRAVFMRLINSGSALPGNGTLYTANTIFGSGTEIGTTGWYCIYNGTGNTVNVTGLMQGSTYRVTVLEYNGTPGDAAYLEVNPPATAPNYLEARVSPANVTTIAIYPTIPARLVTFSNTTSTSTTASWTNGDGTARAVFMELTGTGSVVLTDATTYTPNTTFGVGSTVIMSGKPFYCIYNGTGNSVNITGLSPSTLYRVTVVEYKGAAGTEKYLNTGQSPGNVTTGAPLLNSLVLPKDSGEATPLVSSFNTEKIEANNILSPNGDGINDIWVVKNIAFYPNNTVTVYDRAGRAIFTKKGYTNDWDGTYRGSVVNEGTYYYLIDLGNGTSMKGFITVVMNR